MLNRKMEDCRVVNDIIASIVSHITCFCHNYYCYYITSPIHSRCREYYYMHSNPSIARCFTTQDYDSVLPDGLNHFFTDERVEKAPLTVMLAIVNIMEGCKKC